MLSGHGGIGRRVRLRGVWLHRPSSSLGDRTIKIYTNFRVRVFLCCVTRLACNDVARRIYAQLGLRPTDAPLFEQARPLRYYALRFATSLGERTKKVVSIGYDFFYPSRRLGISSPHKVQRISSALWAVYHHASACISLRLDDMPLFEWMIYKACALIYLR